MGHQMMKPPFMMGMLPQMMYSPAVAGSQAAKKVSPYEKIDGFRPGMEAKVTTRGVSVKKRTWTCMHAVGEALHKRVFWEYPTTYQHKPHHHHQLHDRNQYLSSSSIFGSRVHQEDQGPSPVLSVVRGG